MIEYGGRMPSADGIAVAFPYKILEKIRGTPSRINIDNAQEKQTENAASQPSTRGGGAHVNPGIVVRAKYFGISHAQGHRFRTAVSKA